MRVRLNQAALADLISRSDLSQNHWAIKLGLSSGHLADLVNGRHLYPSAVTREKLIRGLGASFDHLFTIETPEEQPPTGGDLRSRLEAVLSDRYLIDDVVGQGGMGTVFRARDVKHGRPVALKVVLPDSIASLGNAQFLSEIRRTASMQHPNILPLLDSGIGAECPYLVTPLVRDGSLRDLMNRRGPMSPAEALGWLRGVCSALAYAHEQRLVHCDIKPDNVLISGDQSMVTDFGISRAIHLDGRPRSRQIDTSTGTPAYVSPEQVSGEAVDGRSDQYSVACVAYEMLTGCAPFSGSNDMAVVAQRFLEEPPDVRSVLPGIPYSVSAVLRKAMARDTRRRYSTIQHFLRAFETAVFASTRSTVERVEDAANALLFSIRDLVRLSGARRTVSAHRTFHTPLPMTNVIQDVRYALRILVRQPLFAVVAILTLGIGIGTNTAIFSIVNGYLLRALPYPEADRLVTLWEVNENGSSAHVAGANFVDWRDQSQSFSGLAVHPSYAFGGPSTVLGGAQPTRVLTGGVSQDFFDIFRIMPVRGRFFMASDFAGDATPTVVVSHRFWQTQLAAIEEPSDRFLQLGSLTFQVIGVAPPGFQYPDDTDLWVPTTPGSNPYRTSHNWAVIGRLADGVSMTEAQTEMSALAAQMKSAFGEEIDAVDVRVTGLQNELVGSLRQPLMVLLAASWMVLLVACTNIASTLLAQGTARERELAIRGALGASRSRMFRQLIAESVLLSILGAVAGMGFSFGMVQVLARIAPEHLALGEFATVDGVVVGVTLLAALGSTLLFGVYPALKTTRSDISHTLRSGERGNATSGKSWSWRAIVGGEIALALMLLTGAALLMKSFWSIMSVDPGFEPGGVLTADISVPSSIYADDAALSAYYRELETTLLTVPGVETIGIVNHVPMGGSRINGGFDIEGWDSPETPYSDYRVVNGSYFESMGVPVLRGRTFDTRDQAGSPYVAVVNQLLADRYWPGENPVGRRIRNLRNDSWLYPDEWITIVGVVGNVLHRGLNQQPEPEVYVHLAQRPYRARNAIVTLQVSRLTSDMGDIIRDAARSVDQDIPIDLSSMESYIRSSVADRRFTMIILGTFAACALVLAMVGIYGVVSYSVAQRSREMGVRLALGAEPSHVRRLIQGDAMLTVSGGVVVGVLGAFALTRLIQNLLFGVSANDPLIFGTVTVIIVAAAWSASLIPAIRSTRVDPVVTMRGE